MRKKQGFIKIKGERTTLGRAPKKEKEEIRYLVLTDYPTPLNAKIKFVRQTSEDDYFTVIIISDLLLQGGDNTVVFSFEFTNVFGEVHYRNFKIPVKYRKVSVGLNKKYTVFIDRRFVNKHFEKIDDWNIM